MAALDQLKRNLSDLVNDPRGYLEMVADRMNNSVMGRQGTVNHHGAGYRQLANAERQQQIQTGVLDNIGGGGLGIIKAKGGNWLTGSVEEALKGLKSRGPTHRDEALALGGNWERNADDPWAQQAMRMNSSLNKWIEGPLTKYVKRDMATEGDPVRKLAEQGILHFQPPGGFDSRLVGQRTRQGYPGMGVGKSPLAQSWEDVADQVPMQASYLDHLPTDTIGNLKIADALRKQFGDFAAENPQELAYGFNRGGTATDLGFNHLTDELRNALNPESGLPRHLQLTPEQLQQLGMEKAVRHVDAINKWRAAQQAEANAKLAGDHPAVSKVREYADNNPKGLRWVEIKRPEVKLEEGWKVAPQGGSGLFEVVDDIGRQHSVGATEQEAIGLLNRKERQQLLADQLKYEGDTMGHCVGGYCDDVASGRSRIFSLRDAKGEPHVTIEVQPGNDWKNDLFEASRRGNAIDEMFGDRASEIRKAFNESPFNNIQQFLEKNPEYLPQKQNIIQIKGKQNRRPNDEYLPFVQDFVKNPYEGSQWGTVGDLGNTGLRQLGNAFNEMERAKLKTLGHDISPTGYATEAEIQALHDAFNSASGEEIPLHMRGFADGGLINKPQVWEPIEADGVIGFLLR